MSYTVRTVGALAFKGIDLMCPNCKFEEERSVDLRGLTTDEERERAMAAEQIMCPNCEEATLERVWRRVPTVGQYTNPRSPKTIKAMQKSFKQRFVKKEIDDVRHAKGKLFDESLRSAAAQRLKKGEKPYGEE